MAKKMLYKGTVDEKGALKIEAVDEPAAVSEAPRGPAYRVTPEQEAYIKAALTGGPSQGQATLYGKPVGIDPETGDVVVTDPATGIVRPVQAAPLPPSGVTVKDVFDGVAKTDREKLFGGVWGGHIVPGPAAPKSIGELFAEGVAAHYPEPAPPTAKDIYTVAPAPTAGSPASGKTMTGLQLESMHATKEQMENESDAARIHRTLRACLAQRIVDILADGREYVVSHRVIVEDDDFTYGMGRETVKVHAVASVAVADIDAAVMGEYVAVDTSDPRSYSRCALFRLPLPGRNTVQMWKKVR